MGNLIYNIVISILTISLLSGCGLPFFSVSKKRVVEAQIDYSQIVTSIAFFSKPASIVEMGCLEIKIISKNSDGYSISVPTEFQFTGLRSGANFYNSSSCQTAVTSGFVTGTSYYLKVTGLTPVVLTLTPNDASQVGESAQLQVIQPPTSLAIVSGSDPTQSPPRTGYGKCDRFEVRTLNAGGQLAVFPGVQIGLTITSGKMYRDASCTTETATLNYSSQNFENIYVSHTEAPPPNQTALIVNLKATVIGSQGPITKNINYLVFRTAQRIVWTTSQTHLNIAQCEGGKVFTGRVVDNFGEPTTPNLDFFANQSKYEIQLSANPSSAQFYSSCAGQPITNLTLTNTTNTFSFYVKPNSRLPLSVTAQITNHLLPPAPKGVVSNIQVQSTVTKIMWSGGIGKEATCSSTPVTVSLGNVVNEEQPMLPGQSVTLPIQTELTPVVLYANAQCTVPLSQNKVMINYPQMNGQFWFTTQVYAGAPPGAGQVRFNTTSSGSYTLTAPAHTIAVQRRTGVLDTNFAAQGKREFDFATTGYDIMSGLFRYQNSAQFPDHYFLYGVGTICAQGAAICPDAAAQNRIIMARIRTNGDGDPNFSGPQFSTNGEVIYPLPNVIHSGALGAIQQSNAAIIVGYVTTQSETSAVAMRIQHNGVMDATYGVTTPDGIVRFGTGGTARTILLALDGSHLVGGTVTNPATQKKTPFLAWLNVNGELIRPLLYVDFSNYDTELAGVAFDSNGRAIVAATIYENSLRKLALAAVSSNGNLDNTFGPNGNGKWIVTLPFSQYIAAGINWSGTKITVAGKTEAGIALVQSTLQGALASDFGQNGVSGLTGANLQVYGISRDATSGDYWTPGFSQNTAALWYWTAQGSATGASFEQGVTSSTWLFPADGSLWITNTVRKQANDYKATLEKIFR